MQQPTLTTPDGKTLNVRYASRQRNELLVMFETDKTLTELVSIVGDPEYLTTDQDIRYNGPWRLSSAGYSSEGTNEIYARFVKQAGEEL